LKKSILKKKTTTYEMDQTRFCWIVFFITEFFDIYQWILR